MKIKFETFFICAALALGMFSENNLANNEQVFLAQARNEDY